MGTKQFRFQSHDAVLCLQDSGKLILKSSKGSSMTWIPAVLHQNEYFSNFSKWDWTPAQLFSTLWKRRLFSHAGLSCVCFSISGKVFFIPCCPTTSVEEGVSGEENIVCP